VGTGAVVLGVMSALFFVAGLVTISLGATIAGLGVIGFGVFNLVVLGMVHRARRRSP
jgi:hypothetical protein